MEVGEELDRPDRTTPRLVLDHVSNCAQVMFSSINSVTEPPHPASYQRTSTCKGNARWFSCDEPITFGFQATAGDRIARGTRDQTLRIEAFRGDLQETYFCLEKFGPFCMPGGFIHESAIAIGLHGARLMAYRSIRTIRSCLHSLFEVGVTSNLTDGQLLERFADRQVETAELAFAALVQRHGPAVLRVCRAILHNEHDAEDAFQATFLVLVRKGGSLWVRDSLGPWLHRVACHAAGRVKQDSNRRRAHERHLAELLARGDRGSDREDLASTLHQEIDHLPERYRLAVVLCDVEGCPYEVAARQLGWSVATLKGRLTRGRERLRVRLTGRGLAPSSRLLVLGLSAEATSAVVPPVLARSTIKAAMWVAAQGAAATGTVSAPVAALVKGVLVTMALTKWKSGAVLFSLTCAAVAATALVQAQQEAGGREARMGPDRRAATAHMAPEIEGQTTAHGDHGSGLSFDQIRPTIERLLKEHGSAKVTTLDGIEVSVRLYDTKGLARSRMLLEQVLLLGSIDIRGPADSIPVDKAGNAKQKARQLLSSARHDIISGDLDEAARKLSQARAMNVKWGLFDDTPDKAAADLRRARDRPGPPGQFELSAEDLAGIKTLKAAVDIAKQELIREEKPSTRPSSPSSGCERRCRPRSGPMRLIGMGQSRSTRTARSISTRPPSRCS